MARKIEKKVISDDLLFGDDFDEAKLDKIEAQLVRTPPDALDQGKGKRRGEAAPAEAGDDDCIPGASASPDDVDHVPQVEPPPADENPEVSQQQKAAVARVVRSKRLFLMGALSTLILITAGLLSLYWFHWRQTATPLPQLVRHPIEVPSYRHATTFLLLVSPAGKRQELLKVDLELDFWSEQGYETFKSRQLLFHDVIYKFLRKQEPPDNAFEHWEKILEKNLLESLKHNYPETRLNAVMMKGFQRL